MSLSEAAVRAYEAQYKGDQRLIYSARTGAETLLYMMQATTGKRSAVAIGPGYGLAWYLRGYGLVELGRLAEARAALAHAVALSPSNAQYLEELAALDQRERKLDASSAGYRAALDAADISPAGDKLTDKTRAYRGLGYNLAELHRWDAAAAMYRKALAIDPHDAKSTAELRWIAEQRAKGGPAPVS